MGTEIHVATHQVIAAKVGLQISSEKPDFVSSDIKYINIMNSKILNTDIRKIKIA